MVRITEQSGMSPSSVDDAVRTTLEQDKRNLRALLKDTTLQGLMTGPQKLLEKTLWLKKGNRNLKNYSQDLPVRDVLGPKGDRHLGFPFGNKEVEQ